MRTEIHSIARYRVLGVAVYVLWELPATRLGSYTSFSAAKAAAQNLNCLEMET